MRIVIGGFQHETNCFSPIRTTLERFKENVWCMTPEEVVKTFTGTKTAVGGFIDSAASLGFELIPTVYAEAHPGGPVTKEAFDFILGKLLEGIENAGNVDGCAVQLHGAGFTDEYPDMEGRILEEIRRVLGRDVPLLCMIDYHTNYTQKQVDNATVINGPDTYPHVDRYERTLEAMDILVKTIKGELRPVMARAMPGILPSAQAIFTGRHPMKTIIDHAHAIEKDPKVLLATVAGSFPFQDIPDTGIGFIVTTNNDPALARAKAQELANLAWSLRRDFLLDPPPVPAAQAVEEAIAQEGLYVLADIGDNPGGGSTCEGTVLLSELLRQHAKNAVIAVISDLDAVKKCIAAGVGGRVSLVLGGKIDRMHGPPVKVTGTAKNITDGKYVRKGPMSTGFVDNMGRTVVLDCDGVEIILTEFRTQPTDLELYRSVGIEPSEKKILVVKSSVHYRAVHTPIARKIIEVDTPGVMSPRLAGYPYKNIRRPIFPLDVKTLGFVELKTFEEP